MTVIMHGMNINRRFKCFLTSKSLITNKELINIGIKPIPSKMLLASNSVTGSIACGFDTLSLPTNPQSLRNYQIERYS